MYRHLMAECVILPNGQELNAFTLLEVVSEVNNSYNDVIKAYAYEFYSLSNKLICNIYMLPKDFTWLETIQKALGVTLRSKFTDELCTQFIVNLMKDSKSYSQKKKILTVVNA